jgi:hypothetical protein
MVGYSIIGLEQICQDLEEQHVDASIKFDKEKQCLIVQIQDWKGQYEITKIQLNEFSPILLVRMNNKLKEFEELLLNNTLLKVQNQALGNINPKWKEWWQPIKNS